jgi:hypothetical protein
LKEEMRDYLCLPTPFLIGVPKQIWQKIEGRAWAETSEDTVCFDISSQTWTFKDEFGDVSAPKNAAQLLENSLLELSNFQI